MRFLLSLVFLTVLPYSIEGVEPVNLDVSTELVLKNGTEYDPPETTLNCTFARHPVEKIDVVSWAFRQLSSNSMTTLCMKQPGMNLHCNTNGLTFTDFNLVTINHAEFEFGGEGLEWICLLNFLNESLAGQAKTSIYVIDEAEVAPVMTLKKNVTIKQAEDKSKMEFTCNTTSFAPKTTIQWLLDDEEIQSDTDAINSTVILNVSIDDFGKNLSCIVSHRYRNGTAIRDDIEASTKLDLSVEPKIVSQAQDKHVYAFDLEVEALPEINYVQICEAPASAGDVFFLLSNGSWEQDDKFQSGFVQGFTATRLSETRTKINFELNSTNIDEDLKTFYLNLNTEKGSRVTYALQLNRLPKKSPEYNDIVVVADATLKDDDDDTQEESIRQEVASQGLNIWIVIGSVVGGLLLVVVALVVFKCRKPLVERFKGGEYKVAADLDKDVENNGDQETPIIKKTAEESSPLGESEI